MIKGLKTGLVLTGLIGTLLGCGDEEKQLSKQDAGQKPVEEQKEEKKPVALRHNGRVGLEGDVRCYEITKSGRELELEIERQADPRKGNIKYKQRVIDADTVYRCRAAIPYEWIAHNFNHEGKYYDVNAFFLVDAAGKKAYPVHGFNFSDGQVLDFLVGSLDSGRYRLEMPVFGRRRDYSGGLFITYLGTRVVEFNATREVLSSEDVSVPDRAEPRKDDKLGDQRPVLIDPFGVRILEGG